MNSTYRSDVHICRVGLNCIDELLELENSCFTTDRINRRNIRHLLTSPAAHCAGAYHRGQLAGSMVLLFRSNTRLARIYSIAVSPEFRGMGIGRSMMQQAEQEAARRGCNRLRLEVKTDNVPAIRLYESLGFRNVAVRQGYYEDGAHAFVMQKELN